MSSLETVISNARSSAHLAHALMSITAQPPTMAQWLSLEASLESFGPFRNVWPYLVLALRKNRHLDRRRIARVLSRMWADASVPWDAESLRGLARVAHACFDPSLTRRALQALSDLQGLTGPDLLLQASCHAACGDLQPAVVLCEAVLARSPHNMDAVGLHKTWTLRLEDARPPWHVPIVSPDGLRLEPMHVDHAPALAWQYRDPSIADKTLLPHLEEFDSPKDWVEHRLGHPGVVSYVLLHREHGLVGSTEITVSGTEAFLCIWIGTDWQGRGLGRRMVAMACEHAFRSGTEVMLTAAFDHNAASLRTLRGYGFADVDIRAEAPDHDRTFLFLAGRPLAPDEVVRRLTGFADRAETGFVFPSITFQRTAPDRPLQPALPKEAP